MGPSFSPQVDRTLAQPLLGKRCPVTPLATPNPRIFPVGRLVPPRVPARGCGEQGCTERATGFYF